MISPIMTVGGKPLTLAGKLALLFRSADSVAALPAPAAPIPLTSMSGWWDASTLAPGQSYNTLTDKSTAGTNASTGGARAVAHMAGMLNGMFLESGPYIAPYGFSELYPVILDYSINANSVAVGSGGSLTVFLVWSRPNQRQVNGTRVNSTVPLINVNNTTVLSLTGNGDGNDVLMLNGTEVATSKLSLRHTHSARLVYSGTNVDLWLDGAKLSSSVVTQLSATANLSFLNAAHCVFHEAAAWAKVLSDTEHADLSGYARRWPLGSRRAINGILLGQSNASYIYGSTGHLAIARRIAYLTGCLSSNVLGWTGAYGQLASANPTVYSGQGLYDVSGSLFLKSSSADPSTWPLGADGNAFMAALDVMTADERDNLRFVYWFWSESDSLMLLPSMKTTYAAAVKRAISLIRDHLAMTSDKLPVLVISALPFSTDVGCQIHREVMADLCADASVNVHMMLAQAGDATGDNDTWDGSTGLEGGSGNGGHRDYAGQLMYARRCAIPVARAALAANAAASTPDVLSTIDASIPQIGGPTVLFAHDEGGGSVLVTVKHDGGNDLVVPLRAALGVGWTLNGIAIKATACVRVSANQLRVTFPSVPAGALLYYGYGSNLDANAYAVIGRGNAVTDNFASVVLPAGWKIGSDLGDPLSEQPNNPLQATPYGVALT